MKLWLLRARPELEADAYGYDIHVDGITGNRYALRYPDNPLPDENPFKPWYDKMFGVVVRAETEQQARELASRTAVDEDEDTWFNSDYTECVELTVDGDPKIIISDVRQA